MPRFAKKGAAWKRNTHNAEEREKVDKAGNKNETKSDEKHHWAEPIARYREKYKDELLPGKPPSFKKGGVVKKTGLAKVHKGEKIIPKKESMAGFVERRNKETKAPKKSTTKKAARKKA
ncbi:MAG: hypothetical protein ABSB94_02975 [Syntrophorhabdales bacterium]|jgi:hypothetical protein